jgi:DNA sulfur modification protein DndC
MIEKNNINKIIDHIKLVYLKYNRPLIIGYSGGKDSTLVLQLVWESLSDLPKKKLKNNIHVISSDTLVETPIIIKYIEKNLSLINQKAREKNLPIYSHKLRPQYEDSFWVNLIGKGYPAPSTTFRWCTERLKIKPVNKFINDNVSKWGEVTIILGARRSESSSRKQVLEKKKRDKLGLSKHPTLPAAYVFTPIEHMTNDDVWNYLLSNRNPWGGSNRDLSALYKSASDGECPMVVDNSTSPCGNSRFGCWSCTLVEKDTTMESLIDEGEDWMIPLLELRNLLKETQVPENKSKYRDFKRRNGKVLTVRDGSKLAYGPYKIEWRKIFLRKLLQAQKFIQKNNPQMNLNLISMDELELIRLIWEDENPVHANAIPEIYKEEINDDYNWRKDDGFFFSEEDFSLLQTICDKENIPINLISRLINEEKKMHGMTRRVGIINIINKIFDEEWRTEQEILKEIDQNNVNK